ncbi:DUF2382 domain-containing protein [Rhizobium sp. NFR03]|uniref:DUF2382 domain-containing protein n=1 Tax=Rhizobium sp. NFR03 TaxID=1566263 RepID=UPI001114A49C|nr:DUF2382 domain-containing protein [Rhizobium sp. NFR03]
MLSSKSLRHAHEQADVEPITDEVLSKAERKAPTCPPMRPPSSSKEPRVVKEIELRKTAEQREETVSETIRKTEVEVEDSRTASTTDCRKN